MVQGNVVSHDAGTLFGVGIWAADEGTLVGGSGPGEANSFTNCGFGVVISYARGGIRVEGNTIGFGPGSAYGLYLCHNQLATPVTAVGNTIMGTGTGTGVGISCQGLGGDTDSDPTHATLSDNVISGVAIGVNVMGDGSATHLTSVILSSNTIANCAQKAVSIGSMSQTGPAAATLTGNVISGSLVGVDVLSANTISAILTSNTITHCTQKGVSCRAQAGSVSAQMIGNMISECAVGVDLLTDGAYNASILLGGATPAEGNTITRTYATGTFGVRVDGSGKKKAFLPICRNNIISGFEYGIDLRRKGTTAENDAHTGILENILHGNRVGIAVGVNGGPSFAGTIRGNRIYGNAGQGILVATTLSTATVEGNDFRDPSPTPVNNVIDLQVDAPYSVTLGTGGNQFAAASKFIVSSGGCKLDGSSSTYDGIDPSAVGTTLTELFAIQDKIADVLDNAIYGRVRLKTGNLYVTALKESGAVGALVRALGAASSNDTVNVQSGSYLGNVNASTNTLTLAAGSSPGQVIVDGDLMLGSDDALSVELEGLVPGSGFDQWVVHGGVTLSGSILRVTAGAVFAPGDRLVLIANDGTDAVSGAFAGLPQGASVTIGGQEFVVFYNGGDGNDVVLMRKLGTFTTIYVDDVFANPVPGEDPDGEGPAHYYLFDSFTNIQPGVDAVAVSGMVNVASGAYVEQVTITKSLDLIGAGEATTTIRAPAIRTGAVTQGTTVHDYLVAAVAPSSTIDVRIEGFAIDANSKNKTAGTARLDGVFFRNVKNTSGTMAGLFSSTIHNFAATPDYESWGLAIYGDSLLTVNDNSISDYTRDGLLVVGDATSEADPNVTISGNAITGSATPLNGINIQDVTSGIVTGNTVMGHTRTAEWAGGGIVLWSSSWVVITDNHVDGNFYGIDLEPGSQGVAISGNELTGNIKRGITLNDSDNNTVSGNTIAGPGEGTDDVGIALVNSATGNTIGGAVLADGNRITMATAGSGNLYAIHVQADVGAGNNTIRYNTITGGKRAIQFDGPPGCTGTTTVSDNTISGQDFGGICAYNNGNLVISGNSMTDTVRPIEFFGPVNITVTGNTIAGSTFSGINLGAFSGIGIVEHNTISGVPAGNHGLLAQVSGAGLGIHGNIIHHIGERGIQVNSAAINVTIDGNEIYEVAGYAGICIDGGATGAKINNNYVHNNLGGGVVANAQTAEFAHNNIHTNGFGIEAGAADATFVLRNNSIAGNDPDGTASVLFGVNSSGLSLYAGTADAENNWWGADSGPTNAALNSFGRGDAVSANVDFSPWLGDGTDTSLDIGFQPNAEPVYYIPTHLTFSTQPVGAALGSLFSTRSTACSPSRSTRSIWQSGQTLVAVFSRARLRCPQ